jgi:hypothetical protein
VTALAAEIGADRRRAALRQQILAATPGLRTGSRDRLNEWEVAAAAALMARSEMGSLEARVAVNSCLGVLRAAITEWLLVDDEHDLARVLARAFEFFQPSGAPRAVQP